MGTFVSDPTTTLFEDKETAPGLTLRPGWTANNVLSADDANALKNAAGDLRTAHIALQSQVNSASSVGSATPQSVGSSAVVGVATSASREDHVHAHGAQAGGTLHAVAVAGVSNGFVSAADQTKINNLSGTNTGDVSLGTTNGLSLAGQVLSLAAATTSVAGALAATDKTKLNNLTGTNSGDVTIGTANGLSLVGQALSMAAATDSVPGAMSAADHTKLTGIATGATVGVTTMAAVGAVPNANGASISTTTLTLQPADGTNPGQLTAGAQTIGGVKTFSSAPAMPGLSLNGTSSNTITSATTATAGSDTAFVLNATANLDTTSSHTDAIAEFQRNNGTAVYRFNSSGRIKIDAGQNNGQPGLFFTTPTGGQALFRLAGGNGEIVDLIGNTGITSMNLGYNCGTVNVGTNATELVVTSSSISTKAAMDLRVGQSTNTNSSKIVANGVIESNSGGFRFPDGTTLTTATAVTGTTTATASTVAGRDTNADLYARYHRSAYDVVGAYRRAAVQSIGSGAETVIAWDTADIDTHTAATNLNATTFRWTVPTGAGGKYVINCFAQWNTGFTANSYMNLYAYNSSSTLIWSRTLGRIDPTGNVVALSGTCLLQLSAADYVQVIVFQNAGAAKDIANSHMGVHRLPGV